MLFLLAFGLFLIIAASTWWFGLWSNLISLVNFLLSAMVASNYFEPLADTIDTFNGQYTYMADFLSLWAIFVVTFVVLRTLTDFLTRIRLKFNVWVELIGRSVLSVWLAGAFICFTMFSLHLAPLPPDAFQANVKDRNLVVGPDRMWLAFIQSRSRGAFAESRTASFGNPYNLYVHPDDEGKDLRVFDPRADFIFNYHLRRENLSKERSLRVDY